MRVKIPFNGSFFYSNKRFLWFKGTVTKLEYRNGEVKAVETSLRNGNGWKNLGRWWSYTTNIDYIYYTL